MLIHSGSVAKRATRTDNRSAAPDCEMHAQRARPKDIARPLRPGHLALCCVVGLSLLTLAPGKYGFAQSSAPSATTDPSHPDLLQEPMLLNVRDKAGAQYQLEAIIVRPARAEARLPIAIVTHGKPRLASDMALIRAELLVRQARDLAYRGYLAVGVVRRGYGRSGGTPGIATNAPYAKCSVEDLQRYFEVEADDLEAAVRLITERPDADRNRIIVIGGSVGGGTALAMAARKLLGLTAAVNIAGGVRLTNAQGEVICPFETPVAAIGRLGAGARIPTLWIYSENDSVFATDIARRAFNAYKLAGGVAELQVIPAIAPDGHHAFELPNGRVHWLAKLDAFLRARGLVTWRTAQVDAVMRTARVPESSREMVERYFSLYPQGSRTGPRSSRDIHGRYSQRDQCTGPGTRGL